MGGTRAALNTERDGCGTAVGFHMYVDDQPAEPSNGRRGSTGVFGAVAEVPMIYQKDPTATCGDAGRFCFRDVSPDATGFGRVPLLDRHMRAGSWEWLT